MKILGTGLNGLVGSRIIELLQDKYQFENISRSSGVDITNQAQVLTAINNSDASIVLHLAAKTDVDGCEQDKALGENGEAWKINVLGTKYIIETCEQSHKKLIYISTDFVFSGENAPEQGYLEEDQPNPVNWYAQTKYEAEKLVQQSKIPWIIARIAYPYRADFLKADCVRSLLVALQSGKEVTVIEDRIVTPTFIDDIALALDLLITQKQTGIFHLTGGSWLNFYDAALILARIFKLDVNLIKKTTRQLFYQNRASRPFNLPLKNAKIQGLGVEMSSFEEGIEEVKTQILKGKNTI